MSFPLKWTLSLPESCCYCWYMYFELYYVLTDLHVCRDAQDHGPGPRSHEISYPSLENYLFQDFWKSRPVNDTKPRFRIFIAYFDILYANLEKHWQRLISWNMELNKWSKLKVFFEHLGTKLVPWRDLVCF